MPSFEFLNQLRGKPKFIRIVRMIGLGLTIVAILVAVRQGSNQISIGNWKGFVGAWAISFGAYTVAFVFQALAWCTLIGGLCKYRVGWKDLEIYAISNIMKRTPGAFWYLFERVERYGKHGMNAQITLAASGIEWLLLVVAGVLLYILVSLNGTEISFRIIVAIASLLLLFLSYITLRRRASYVAASEASNYSSGKISRLISAGPEISSTLLIDGVSHLLCSIIIYELVQSSFPSSLFSISNAVRVWTLTGVIAIISSIAIPVNLGLREFTISALLLTFVPFEFAITVAAEVRLIFLLADMSCSFSLWYLARWFLARQGN